MLPFPLACRSRSLAAFSLLILLVSLMPAQAQTPSHSWQVTYSNTGTWSYTSPSATPPDQSGPWPVGASGYSLGGSDTRNGNIQGTVTATLTWVPASGKTMQSDPPPSSVAVIQYGNAYEASLLGTDPNTHGPAGSASDGLGDTPVVSSNGNGYVSSGYHGLPSQSGSSGNIVLSGVTLSAVNPPFSVTSGYPPYTRWPGGQTSVSYRAYPVNISLSGTTPDSSGNLNILVGQGCTASLVGIPSDLLNNTDHPPTYSWTVSGTRFQAWSPYPPPNFIGPVNPNGSFYSDGPGPLTNPTAHWYWNEAAGTETVKCTVTVTPPSGLGAPFPIMVTQQVSVANLTYSCTHYEGVVAVINGGQTLVAYPTGINVHGETWNCHVLTPALFGGGGSCNFSQLITPGRSHTYSTGSVSCTENGKSGLDTLSPYSAESGDPYTVGTGANAGWPADNSSHRTGDSPSTGLSDPKLGVCASVSITESFNTFLMYLPPGSDVQPVPLHEVDWNWNATVSEPPGGWASANMTPVGPSLTSTASARAYAHPQWIRVESPAVGSGW